MMRLRLYIDVMAADADVGRLAEYMAAQRLMMIDRAVMSRPSPGGSRARSPSTGSRRPRRRRMPAEGTTNGDLGWAIVELLGHRRLAGMVTEVQIAGAGFLRVDVPDAGRGDGWYATQYVAPGSVYAITPVSEETARAVAPSSQPRPVERWELPPAQPEAMTFDDPTDPGF
jgi:hypothetical protein